MNVTDGEANPIVAIAGGDANGAVLFAGANVNPVVTVAGGDAAVDLPRLTKRNAKTQPKFNGANGVIRFDRDLTVKRAKFLVSLLEKDKANAANWTLLGLQEAVDIYSRAGYQTPQFLLDLGMTKKDPGLPAKIVDTYEVFGVFLKSKTMARRFQKFVKVKTGSDWEDVPVRELMVQRTAMLKIISDYNKVKKDLADNLHPIPAAIRNSMRWWTEDPLALSDDESEDASDDEEDDSIAGVKDEGGADDGESNLTDGSDNSMDSDDEEWVEEEDSKPAAKKLKLSVSP